MLFNKLFQFVLVVILVLISVAFAQTPYTRRLTIHPKVRFCLLLPKSIGTPIGSGVANSISYCTSATSVVRYARKFPDGFIKSAHYYEGIYGSYTQVTGRIDRSKFHLSSHDQGAQTMPSSPSGSYCVGFNYFVQFVEPNENIYCLRCCHSANDCPTNLPDKGCKAVIHGNYN